MKILIETYRLLRKMGIYKAWSTVEIVEMVNRQRCAVLKRLHRLEDAKVIEKRLGPDQKFYWKVAKLPDKPPAPKLWKESLSLVELEEIRLKALNTEAEEDKDED